MYELNRWGFFVAMSALTSLTCVAAGWAAWHVLEWRWPLWAVMLAGAVYGPLGVWGLWWLDRVEPPPGRCCGGSGACAAGEPPGTGLDEAEQQRVKAAAAALLERY